MQQFGGDDIEKVITEGGTVFRKAKQEPVAATDKVKTKARKKRYITGLHGSAAAKKKADIRTRRANRHKK